MAKIIHLFYYRIFRNLPYYAINIPQQRFKKVNMNTVGIKLRILETFFVSMGINTV